MVLGDGIRRNIASVSPQERALLRDAIIQLNKQPYPGSRNDSPPGGVTKWFKQDEIHAHSHVHGCPAFLPWHRELVNRFEQLIRSVNPQLSMHYWDWTQDPQNIPDGKGGTLNLFTPDFMGGAHGEAGAPWRSMNAWDFYNPNASPSRSDSEFDPNNNPADPPLHLTRNVQPGPVVANDDALINSPDFVTFDQNMAGPHGSSHSHIGGTLSDQHTSFRDPFVFLLHTNIDRIFALWQLKNPSVRVDPDLVYDAYSFTKGSGDILAGANWGILSPLEPWAGPAAQTAATGVVANVVATRPWASPENEQLLPQNQKNSKHPTVVKPPYYDTNPIIIDLANSTINFNDVPSNETAIRAAHFRCIASFPLTFHVTSGPGSPYTVFSTNGTISVPPSSDIWTDAYLYFSVVGGAPNTMLPNTTATIHCDEANRDFTVTLTGNSIPQPTVAVMLVLDQSGSMDDPAGQTGVKRISALREAAGLFVDLIQPGNGVGIIRFDTKAYPTNDPIYPGLPITLINTSDIFDGGRKMARDGVMKHATNPQGFTSIGAGVHLARDTLAPVAGFQDKALLVFTDGLENTPPYIADVLADIDQRTFAIGLGDAQQVSTAALAKLTGGTGGFLLLSGLLSSSIDDYYLLSKYFLQILAGVTNQNIVLDPSGFITHCHHDHIPNIGDAVLTDCTHIIPFYLNEADIECTVVLLTDIPALDFVISTPAGQLITPSNAKSVAVDFARSGTTSYYRYKLPVPIGGGAKGGKWKVLLRLDEVLWREHRTSPHKSDGVRYSVTVMTWSNIHMRASVSQNSLQPGATLTLRVSLDEYGVPIENRASVHTDVTSPDGHITTLALAEVQPGVFEVSTVLNVSGTYRFHVKADGVTLRGVPFTREQLLTSAVFLGGDQPLPTTPPQPPQNPLCCLLGCLLKEKSVNEFLVAHKLDPKEIARCVERCCHQS